MDIRSNAIGNSIGEIRLFISRRSSPRSARAAEMLRQKPPAICLTCQAIIIAMHLIRCTSLVHSNQTYGVCKPTLSLPQVQTNLAVTIIGINSQIQRARLPVPCAAAIRRFKLSTPCLWFPPFRQRIFCALRDQYFSLIFVLAEKHNDSINTFTCITYICIE